ncbi:MAG TPA: LytTR family DNA-binding domain-containing protein [Chitinophagales bacterium]|nr:LytTR family DNA-binding domain-containing protein [Chitinophagales bacterium]
MNLNVIIVDDEESGANVLRLLLEKYFNNIRVQTICHKITDAQKAILMFRPDIVFLDIRMQKENGFDLLNKFEKINFAVIFVTAYDEYALRAIKLRAVDYLLKPANKIDLEVAINKAVELLPLIRNNEYYYPKNNKAGEILVLNKYKNTHLYLHEICYIIADSNYSIIYDVNKKRHTTSKTLKDMEELLCNDSYNFVRIHKSVIVNTQHLVSFKTKGDNLVVSMPNDEEFEVAQRKKTEVKYILSSLVRR